MGLREIGMSHHWEQVGSCGHGNETSGSMKCWEFLENLSKC
jgi:hypothetical protein